MIVDNYKIIIFISHHRISYEYWQCDGENKLMSLPNGNWPAPLAFFCSDTGIVIGEDAVRAVNSGNLNAFDNYFGKLAEDLTYKLGGQTCPIRNLLLDASEAVFREFFSHVLFNRLGSLSDNRSSMPLIIVCESDIKPNERALLKGLFKDSGYDSVRIVEYDRYVTQYINETLSAEYACNKVVVAWSESSDLTMSIFGTENNSEPIVKTFENLGIDPRKEYVENVIWERIIGQNPWLQRKNETETISKAATDFLNSSLPLVNDTITLSDGRQYHYSLNRSTIDYVNCSENVSIREALDRFLGENGISDRSTAILLLRGSIAGNSYFEQNLSHGFSSVIKSDTKLRNGINNIIISEQEQEQEPEIGPAKAGTQKETNNKTGEKAEFKDDSQKSESGVQEKPEPPVVPPVVPPVLPPGDDDLNEAAKKELLKKWRQVKDAANGKYHESQADAAIQLLNAFRSENSNNPAFKDVIGDFDIEIAKYATPVSDDSEIAKKLAQKWSVVKVAANGKVRSGNKAEARSDLQKFLSLVKKNSGSAELIASIETEISQITDEEPSNDPSLVCEEELRIPDSAKILTKSTLHEYGNADWCRRITTIFLPKSLTKVQLYTVRELPQLKKIVIPAGEFNRFAEMMPLDWWRMYYEDGTSVCPEISVTTRNLFVYPYGTKVVDGRRASCNVLIPPTCTEIPEDAFKNNGSVETITMTDSIVSIGKNAFKGCKKLKTIRLSGKIKEIPASMVEQCELLREITIPEGVKSIGKAAFARCNSLKKITLPNSVVSIDNGGMFGLNPFQHDSAINKIVVPKGTKSKFQALLKGFSGNPAEFLVEEILDAPR